jgi:hypothetical protein
MMHEDLVDSGKRAALNAMVALRFIYYVWLARSVTPHLDVDNCGGAKLITAYVVTKIIYIHMLPLFLNC